MTITALDLVERKRPKLCDVISGNALDRPHTLEPHHTVRTACERMDNTAANALLVLDCDGAPVGIVSLRDIVCNIARNGVDILDWPVERIMTRDVVIERENTNCQVTLSHMFEKRFRNMPVCDENDHVLACVETLDVAKAKLAELTESNRKLMELLLRENNERNTVRPDMDLTSVAQLMRQCALDHVVVHDGTRCLGYITPDEALRAIHQDRR